MNHFGENKGLELVDNVLATLNLCLLITSFNFQHPRLLLLLPLQVLNYLMMNYLVILITTLLEFQAHNRNCHNLSRI